MLASWTNHFLRFVHDRKSAPQNVRLRHCQGGDGIQAHVENCSFNAFGPDAGFALSDKR